jgi:hypothetical protein
MTHAELLAEASRQHTIKQEAERKLDLIARQVQDCIARANGVHPVE